MLEKIVVTALVLALTYLAVSPLVERVANSMDASANMIAEATQGTH